jgi:hypothetical protein
MKHFGVIVLSPGMLAMALSACAVNGTASTDDESVSRIQLAVDSCSVPANGSGSVCDIGGGSLEYQVTLPSGQQYVELFATQNGIQNVASDIVASGASSGDGTTTYSFVQSGYSAGDAIEYRFYSYLPASPGVFTPGPAEQVWYYDQVAPPSAPPPPSAGQIDLPVTKDASLIFSSFAFGSGADQNFGANPTVDVAEYHEDAQGLLGYSLTGIPTGATVTKAELVIPGSYEGAGGLVSLSGVNDSSSWQELTVTWNTTPASTLFGDFAMTPNITNRLDVTSFVAQAIARAQGEVSFLLASLSSSNVFIDSKEKAGGQPTYLHVEWH